jgi:hypothetical protein
MPASAARKLIGENVKLTNKKSRGRIVVQIRNSRNMVAFKTPRVSKKTPSLIFQ